MTMMGGQGVKTVLASHSQKVPNCVWLMCVQTHWGVCSHYACCRIMNLNFSISMPLVSSLNFPHLWEVHLICLSFKLRTLIVELWNRKEHVTEMRKDSFGKNIEDQELTSKKIRWMMNPPLKMNYISKKPIIESSIISIGAMAKHFKKTGEIRDK